MKEILLTRGKVALVSDEDYVRVNALRWHAVKTSGIWYASHGKNHWLAMHRFILDAQPGTLVDHKNRDGLDNQRGNIRLATKSQNAQNQILRATNTSGYKGVAFHSQTGKWNAAISFNGRKLSLGLHLNPETAARAYDTKAKELFGEFARLNFPAE